MEKESRIPVHIVNGNAFIWDPEDVINLRIKYRIVGSLVGLLPKCPLQNIFSSLPLHLLPEEVSLLLEKGCIYLINDKKAHHKPNSSEIKLFKEEEEKLKEKDNQDFQKQKNEHMLRNLNKKNNKNNIKNNTNNKKLTNDNDNRNTNNNNEIENISNEKDNNTNGISNDNFKNSNISNEKDNNTNGISNDNFKTLTNPNNIKEKENNNDYNNDINNGDNNNAGLNNSNSCVPKKKKKEKEKSQLIHIQTNSKKLPWYDPSKNNHENECYTLEEAKSKNIWNYPNTPNENMKYKIFCDIWGKPEKYYITSGSKYGSDYLIYPGDPIQYHSNFIATVVYDTNFNYSPKYIIKYGRLGTNVKKTHLLCNIDQSTQKINYYSIEWSSWI
ncbi:hypothetical protein BCR36DRAFT_338048 [Piromyces finnis]|uniref:tRNA-intron lyase n=1 Tax=Piromyces finnis TaxID=1754191 RepID=A0A1Y1UVK2_9FUNG|nr:hypothetical protein BCR36DRAFT_338048 [Piromyces finnis]|eukprot:ORX42081.1 hypothetical protein BCR36DRAFT_338048 [Piromyces finnis]